MSMRRTYGMFISNPQLVAPQHFLKKVHHVIQVLTLGFVQVPQYRALPSTIEKLFSRHHGGWHVYNVGFSYSN